jgi:hypothetical protein
MFFTSHNSNNALAGYEGIDVFLGYGIRNTYIILETVTLRTGI